MQSHINPKSEARPEQDVRDPATIGCAGCGKILNKIMSNFKAQMPNQAQNPNVKKYDLGERTAKSCYAKNNFDI